MNDAEARQHLRDVFGGDYSERMILEGFVGGGDLSNDELEARQAGVVRLARQERPDLSDDDVNACGEAWFTLWVAAE